MFGKLSVLFLTSLAGATELTSDDWDTVTAGKTVFVKFQAPWWGHCKRMKPDWDKLMDEFKDSKTSLVADVDCTAAGKPLCEKVGVSGYPTIKYGDPNALKDYSGGRTFDDLKKFAEENLGPSCGVEHLDLCDDETRAILEGFQKMEMAELQTLIDADGETLAKIEAKHDKALEKLTVQNKQVQAKLEKETKAKEAALDKEQKKLSLKIKKSVLTHKKKQEEGGKKKRKDGRKKKKEL